MRARHCFRCVTSCISTHCKTHCFSLRNSLFQPAKPTVLFPKTISFRKQTLLLQR